MFALLMVGGSLYMLFSTVNRTQIYFWGILGATFGPQSLDTFYSKYSYAKDSWHLRTTITGIFVP